MRTRFIALASGLVLSACSTSAVGTLPTVHAVSPAAATLQLAVGTARIGLLDGSSTVGLNVVATYRQPNGGSATLQNTPTLSGPQGSGLFGGRDAITGVTPAALHALTQGATLTTTPSPGTTPGFFGFGSLVGVYGYGLAPQNLVDYGDHAAVYSVTAGGFPCDGPVTNLLGYPYYPSASPNRPDQALALPLYFGGSDPAHSCNQQLLGNPVAATTSIAVTSGSGGGFAFLGTPPAWPAPSGYGTPSGFLGYPVGFTDFATAPVPGVYTLQVAAPTNPDDSASTTVTAAATLPASAIGSPLPGMPKPQIQLRADGSALLALNVPPGASETIVFLANACGAAQQQVRRYSVLTHAAGQQVLLLSNNLGPPDASGKPSATLFTCQPGDGKLAAVAVGFDYPAREASYPESTTPTPAITNGDGHGGTADITTSSYETVAY